jgi:hypothetical protein
MIGLSVERARFRYARRSAQFITKELRDFANFCKGKIAFSLYTRHFIEGSTPVRAANFYSKLLIEG